MSCLICIEGLIGAGKSTLVENLVNLTGGNAFYEPVEGNPYLEKFYQDPKTYALPMQYFMMANRYDIHQKAIESAWKTGKMSFCDRSIYGDAVFCRKLYQDGHIDQLGYKSYLYMRSVMERTLLIPQVVLYLDVKPETCLDRISTRGRGCEKNIPIEYLQGLQEGYEDLLIEMEKKGSQIVRIDWSRFLAPQDVLAVVASRLPAQFSGWKIK